MRAILVLVIALFSVSAFASTVSLTGRNLASGGCAYYSSSTAELSFALEDQEIAWNSKVELRYWFRDSFRDSGREGGRESWSPQRMTTAEMVATGPYTWKLNVTEPSSGRGSYFFNRVGFVFHVTGSDGSERWIKGSNSAHGHYAADLPQMVCQPDAPWTSMSAVPYEKD